MKLSELKKKNRSLEAPILISGLQALNVQVKCNFTCSFVFKTVPWYGLPVRLCALPRCPFNTRQSRGTRHNTHTAAAVTFNMIPEHHIFTTVSEKRHKNIAKPSQLTSRNNLVAETYYLLLSNR